MIKLIMTIHTYLYIILITVQSHRLASIMMPCMFHVSLNLNSRSSSSCRKASSYNFEMTRSYDLYLPCNTQRSVNNTL
jgi:hypothetical protein